MIMPKDVALLFLSSLGICCPTKKVCDQMDAWKKVKDFLVSLLGVLFMPHEHRPYTIGQSDIKIEGHFLTNQSRLFIYDLNVRL